MGKDEFTSLVADLANNISSNIQFFKSSSITNPNLAYSKLNELAGFVGSRYNVKLEIHFPNSNKIYSTDDYGKENLSIVVDRFRKVFPIPRAQIKKEAATLFKNSMVTDGYMYEGKEGVKIVFDDKARSRIEVLPGSVHLWVRVDKDVEKFCNWLMLNVYAERQPDKR